MDVPYQTTESSQYISDRHEMPSSKGAFDKLRKRMMQNTHDFKQVKMRVVSEITQLPSDTRDDNEIQVSKNNVANSKIN